MGGPAAPGRQRHAPHDDDARRSARPCGRASRRPLVLHRCPGDLRGTNWSTTINGTNARLAAIRNWGLAGRRLRAADVDAGARSWCSARPSSRQLFGRRRSDRPVDAHQQRPFQVVGVLARKGQTRVGQDQDDVVLIPSPRPRSCRAAAHAGPAASCCRARDGRRQRSADRRSGAAAPAPPHRQDGHPTTSRCAT